MAFTGCAMAQASREPAKAPAPGKPAPPSAMTIKCKGPDGKACTSANVSEIMSGIASGKRIHKPLAIAEVKSVSLAGADGSLTCTQNNGQPCTEDQVKAIESVAADAKCSINYNSSKSNTITK